jgi:hypothetical protein
MTNYHVKHSLPGELGDVHTRMIEAYELEQAARVDAARAKKMEQYLRAFKMLGKNKNKNNPAYQDSLEAQAFQKVAREVGQALGIEKSTGYYSLFGNVHSAYISQQKEWGADDVFEAEFVKLLELAGQKAASKQTTITMGVSLTGGKSANIDTKGLDALSNLSNSMVHQALDDFGHNGQEIIQRHTLPSDLITMPTFRSGKVDATGFNREWIIEADIKPEWQGFVSAFAGATFTLKNYNSKSKTETIHLGSSNLYKAMYGTLNGQLGYDADESAHIYYHTINFYGRTKDEEVGSHIIHLRFVYELTGQGLYDMEGNRLDGADFFIYNDPVSDNVWVRSTKEMIAEIQNYIGNVSDPLHSGIVLLKNSFS